MKKIISVLSLILVLSAVIAFPMTTSADTTTVTGSTLSSYTIQTTAAFGSMAPGSTKTLANQVTASYASSVAVSVANASASYYTGRLLKLEYVLSDVAQITITAPLANGAGAYSVSGSPATMAATDVWGLKATTGTVAGAWDNVEITLTVTPT
ncbi:hypothetical protein [Dehalogenimonas alkenigignens]|uniref:hypothetical protein n=1 Tax=Dehalogenimonas alkenigignens TaxID=1217799 RepID=UPI001057E776|nr:hypothetical protein [Dehalogenimonas alkenigignens]